MCMIAKLRQIVELCGDVAPRCPMLQGSYNIYLVQCPYNECKGCIMVELWWLHTLMMNVGRYYGGINAWTELVRRQEGTCVNTERILNFMLFSVCNAIPETSSSFPFIAKNYILFIIFIPYNK